MSTQVVLQGTLKPDGTLELDQKVPMPAGRVLVTMQPLAQPAAGDPFWQAMERLWAAQQARGHVPRSALEVEAQRQALREESEQEIQEALRHHSQSQRHPGSSQPDQDPGP